MQLEAMLGDMRQPAPSTPIGAMGLQSPELAPARTAQSFGPFDASPGVRGSRPLPTITTCLQALLAVQKALGFDVMELEFLTSSNPPAYFT